MRPAPFAHHTEPSDPELVEWLVHRIDAILGVGPIVMVVAIGLVVIAIPAVIALLARRRLSPPPDRGEG